MVNFQEAHVNDFVKESRSVETKKGRSETLGLVMPTFEPGVFNLIRRQYK